MRIVTLADQKDARNESHGISSPPPAIDFGTPACECIGHGERRSSLRSLRRMNGLISNRYDANPSVHDEVEVPGLEERIVGWNSTGQAGAWPGGTTPVLASLTGLGMAQSCCSSEITAAA